MVEHYLRCPVALGVARKRLGLLLTPPASLDTLLLSSSPCSVPSARDWLVRCAVFIYALYKTTNAARHNCALTADCAARAISQAIVEGALGHAEASAAVDGWRANPPSIVNNTVCRRSLGRKRPREE